jgi:hypothetical protein
MGAGVGPDAQLIPETSIWSITCLENDFGYISD